MRLKNKKILVTGAGGFIGSHLIEYLAEHENAHIRAFIRYNSRNSWGNIDLLPPAIKNGLEIVPGDITDPFSVRKAVAGCDAVFHLAALIGIPYSYSAPESYAATNVMGTINVMQACLDSKVEKVIHTSTSEVYGTALYVPIDEKHPLQAQSPYSASKIGADKIAESYHLSFGLPAATIRPFNAYGPRQSARAVIPAIITQAFAAQKTIRLGSLSPVRDFTYVKDTVRGFVAVAKSDKTPGEVVNIGSGQGITVKELVSLIGATLKTDLKVLPDACRVRPAKSEIMKLICANRKARELTEWVPNYDLKRGLSETAAFIRENMRLYRPGVYNI